MSAGGDPLADLNRLLGEAGAEIAAFEAALSVMGPGDGGAVRILLARPCPALDRVSALAAAAETVGGSGLHPLITRLAGAATILLALAEKRRRAVEAEGLRRLN